MRRRVVRTIVLVGVVALVPLVTSADSIPHTAGRSVVPGGSLGQSGSGRYHPLGADRTPQHSIQSPGALDWSGDDGHDVYFFSGTNDTSPMVVAWDFGGVAPIGGNEQGRFQTGAGGFPSALDAGGAGFLMPGGPPWGGWRSSAGGNFGAFGETPAGANYVAYGAPFFPGAPGAPSGNGAAPGSNAVGSGGQDPSAGGAGDPGNGSPSSLPGSSGLSPSPGGEAQSSSPTGGSAGAPPVVVPSNVVAPTDLVVPSNLIIPADVVIPDDATPAKVPEPGSLALLATALLGLGFIEYFRRRRSVTPGRGVAAGA